MSAARETFFEGLVPGRKGEILDAAVLVFGRKGYEAGSLREIADLVGVTEPAIYRHFESKQALFEQLIAATGTKVVGEVGPLLESATLHNLAEVLNAAAADRAARLPDYGPIIQTAMVAAVHNPEFLEIYRASIIKPIIARVTELVRRIDAESGRDADADALPERVHMLASVFVGYFVTGMLMGATRMSVADSIVRVMGWDER